MGQLDTAIAIVILPIIVIQLAIVIMLQVVMVTVVMEVQGMFNQATLMGHQVTEVVGTIVVLLIVIINMVVLLMVVNNHRMIKWDILLQLTQYMQQLGEVFLVELGLFQDLNLKTLIQRQVFMYSLRRNLGNLILFSKDCSLLYFYGQFVRYLA